MRQGSGIFPVAGLEVVFADVEVEFNGTPSTILAKIMTKYTDSFIFKPEKINTFWKSLYDCGLVTFTRLKKNCFNFVIVLACLGAKSNKCFGSTQMVWI